MRTHGKGIRPTLVLLAASLGEARPNEQAIRAAVIVELLHEATLVHDDVVDEADVRRGWPTLSVRFKNKVAVLFGDYMLANVLASTLEARDMVWLDVLSETARRMAKGELLQAARSRSLDMTEADYISMIGDKTASLMNAACRLGGLSAGLSAEQVASLGVYGESLGLAFQIKDDLLDLFGDAGIGKPVGGDLKERKLTLPLLAALPKAAPREARRIRARIRRGIKRGEIKDIAAFVRQHDGEDYAIRAMNDYRRTAQEALASLPDRPAREKLLQLADFAVERRS
jgi:octaprenyl-diphosphate synthase